MVDSVIKKALNFIGDGPYCNLSRGRTDIFVFDKDKAWACIRRKGETERAAIFLSVLGFTKSGLTPETATFLKSIGKHRKYVSGMMFQQEHERFQAGCVMVAEQVFSDEVSASREVGGPLEGVEYTFSSIAGVLRGELSVLSKGP